MRFLCISILFLTTFKVSNSFNYLRPVFESESYIFYDFCSNFYEKLGDESLSFECFKTAMTGFQTIINSNNEVNPNLLSIIDYSKPSTEKRFYIVDIENECILMKSLVSHGVNSGDNYAESFSNKTKSHMSSLGFYLTGDAYSGSHGYSLKLMGLEKEYNSNAYDRAIVIHPARYVSEDYIKKYGRLGRSFGCPALPVSENQNVIDIIKDKTCLFIYYPDSIYLSSSSFL